MMVKSVCLRERLNVPPEKRERRGGIREVRVNKTYDVCLSNYFVSVLTVNHNIINNQTGLQDSILKIHK